MRKKFANRIMRIYFKFVVHKSGKCTLSDEGKQTHGKAKNYLLKKGKRRCQMYVQNKS